MRRFVALLAMLALLLAVVPTTGAADLAERRQAIGQEEALRGREREAALTLLSLDEELKASQALVARLRAGLPGAVAAVNKASARYRTARATLARDQKMLGLWLNFLYRYGSVSLVAEVLEAKSWSDFVTRLVFVTGLMENQAALWQKARGEEAVCARSVADLQDKEAALRREEAVLAGTIAGLEKKQEARKAFLASLEQQSAILAREVAAEEAGWVAALQPLSEVLANLGGLPWDQMAPDNISFGFSGVTLQFDDTALSGVLDSGGAGLQLASSPSGVTISGSADGVSYALQASLSVAGPRTVRLVPRELDLAGLPVQEATLLAVTGGATSFNLPDEYPQWKLSSISTGAGYVDFVFGR